MYSCSHYPVGVPELRMLYSVQFYPPWDALLSLLVHVLGLLTLVIQSRRVAVPRGGRYLVFILLV